MAVLFENQRQAVYVANCALKAERNLWSKFREDVLTLADDALKSFQARGGQSTITAWECVEAVLEIATEFLPKAASDAVTSALNVANAASPVLKNALKADPGPGEPALDGSDHLAVEDSLVIAIDRLKEKVQVAEDLVHDMARQMAQKMREDDPSPFHIHGLAGLSKTFTDAAAEIRINVDELQRLGTTYLPDVIWEVTRAADIMMDAVGDSPWERSDWSVGDGGRARGAFSDLLNLTYTYMTSSGAELIEAGSILAEHAGAIGNVDAQIGEQMDRTAQEVNPGAPTGDMSPHLAPQPGVSPDQQYSDDAPVQANLANRLGS